MTDPYYEDERLEDLLQPPDDECPYCNGDGFRYDVVNHVTTRCSCTINEDNR